MHILDSSPKSPRSPVRAPFQDRKSVADQFELIADLTELHSGEESAAIPFRSAASVIRGSQEQGPKELQAQELDEMLDLDPSMRSLAAELMVTGDANLRKSLLDSTPAAILALLPLPGLGPRRLRTVWKEMGITDATTLQHAATENRLVHQKGFGPKTQAKVLQSLAHLRAQARAFTLSDLRPIAKRLETELLQLLGPNAQFSFTGEYRRGLTICNGLDLIVAPDHYREILLHLIQTPDYEIITAASDRLLGRVRDTEIHFDFIFRGANYHLELFRTSGSKEHVDLIPVDLNRNYRSESAIYEDSGLPYLEPELREGKAEVKLALAKKLPRLIHQKDIKGLLHVHSTYSDGSDSLEALANQCRNLGMEYLGITDHGPHHKGKCLTPETIVAQHAEIDRLNLRMAPFRILKGVEAEILPDGSLGMSDELLAKFDFVIASLHPEAELSRSDATIRLLRAVQNPFTTILGHVTGRMLLAHEGQQMDIEAIIDACATNQVSLELNCHPSRMDLDWQWIRKAVEQGVEIAINPNAHSISALMDYETGIVTARKGLVSRASTLNAQNLDSLQAWLQQRRAKHAL